MRFFAQRGQVLPMVAVAAVALLGFAALAADVGYDRYQQRLQQTAADSAAIAGAQERASGDWLNAARADASSNGYTDTETGTPASCHASETCVVVNNPPATGSYTTDNTAVEVIISKPYPSFFQRVFGSGNIKFTTRAVARLVNGTPTGCVYMLDATANTNYNRNTSVTATNCTMYFNGSINTNGATVTAQHVYLGNLAGSNTSGVSPAPVSLGAPADDPCPQIDACAYLTANPPSTSGCTASLTQNGGTMSPGCYSSVTLSNTVTLSPGLYIVNGTWGTTGNKTATLTGTGVTLYVTSSGMLNFNKVNTGPLSAPTSGTYNGVLIYQVAGNANVNFNSSVNDLTGMLYMPSACPNFNKSSSGYTMLVFRCANFNSGSETFGTPPGSGSGFIKDAVLAE